MPRPRYGKCSLREEGDHGEQATVWPCPLAAERDGDQATDAEGDRRLAGEGVEGRGPVGDQAGGEVAGLRLCQPFGLLWDVGMIKRFRKGQLTKAFVHTSPKSRSAFHTRANFFLGIIKSVSTVAITIVSVFR